MQKHFEVVVYTSSSWLKITNHIAFECVSLGYVLKRCALHGGTIRNMQGYMYKIYRIHLRLVMTAFVQNTFFLSFSGQDAEFCSLCSKSTKIPFVFCCRRKQFIPLVLFILLNDNAFYKGIQSHVPQSLEQQGQRLSFLYNSYITLLWSDTVWPKNNHSAIERVYITHFLNLSFFSQGMKESEQNQW